MKIPKEPALILGLVGSIVAFILQVMSQVEGQTLTLGQWATIVVPGAFGILTRFQVVPVETVRSIVTTATGAGTAVVELGAKVGVAIEDTVVHRTT